MDSEQSTTAASQTATDPALSLSDASNTAPSRARSLSIPPLSAEQQQLFAPLLSQLQSLQSDLSNELNDEFSQPKADLSSIKDICRYFLNEYIKINEKFIEKNKVKNPQSNVNSVPDSVVLGAPLLTDELRAKMWKLFLGVANKDESAIERWLAQEKERKSSISDTNTTTITDTSADNDSDASDNNRRSTPEPLIGSNHRSEKLGQQSELISEQHLIHRDVERTRPSDPRFHDNYRNDLQSLLTFYCKSRGVRYKQGLNEILTPIIVLAKESNESLGSAYNLFYSLISKFLPSIFNDNEFENLRLIFRTFRLLLRYYDPVLALHVDTNEILPELYATPWFITLFARDLNINLLFFLWDYYLIEDDPFFHYYLALAVLIQHREAMLALDSMELPIYLRKLTLSSLVTLLTKARQLRDSTPVNVRQRLYEISFNMKNDSSRIESLSEYESLLPAMRIPASEIVQQAYSDLTGDSHGIKFIVIDCREKRQFEAGHLPCAIHYNPVNLFDNDGVAWLTEQYQGMKGQHFCFVGAMMKSYTTVAQECGTESLTNYVTNTNNDTHSDAPKYYLTPAEVKLFDDDDRKKAEEKKRKLGAGAPPPVATPVIAAVSKAVKATASVVGHALASASPSLAPATGSASLPTPPLSPSVTPASSPPPAPFTFIFPATNPLMDPYTASLIHVFQTQGFPHVSVCEGGYHACHELVNKYKSERSTASTSASVSGSGSASDAQSPSPSTVISQSIELVDHAPANCLFCSPHVYEKWRDAQAKKRADAAKVAERERFTAEKRAAAEKIAAEKAALKAQQQADKELELAKKAEEAEKERQRKIEAGEIVDAAPTTAAADGATVPAASEKLGSFKRWLSDKSKALSTPTTTAHSVSSSPAPILMAEAARATSPLKSNDEVKSQVSEKNEDSAAEPAAETAVASSSSAASSSAAAASASPTVAEKASSLWNRWGREAQSLAKKMSETAATLTASTPMSEKDRAIHQHLAEKRAEREDSLAIDLHQWLTDPNMALFAAHEVRKIPGSTQGLLIPRVLAVSNGYVIALRPESKRDQSSGGGEEGVRKSAAGLFDRISATIAQVTANHANNTSAHNDSEAATSANSSPTPPTASAFSLAPADDPSIDCADANNDADADASGSGSSTPPTPSSRALSLTEPSNEPFRVTGTGQAYIHSKRRLTDLDRITSKKERPCLLTFHWKTRLSAPTTPSHNDSSSHPLSPSNDRNVTLYVIDRPKECIETVKQRYGIAKAAQREQLAHTIKQIEPATAQSQSTATTQGNDDDDDGDDEDESEEESDSEQKETSKPATAPQPQAIGSTAVAGAADSQPQAAEGDVAADDLP